MAPRPRNLSVPEADALRHSRIDGHVLYLPEQLERGLFLGVEEALRRVGGEWDRNVGGLVFDRDPAPLIAEMLAAGQAPPENALAYYPTPSKAAGLVIGAARLDTLASPGVVLDPSCGDGALLDGVREWVRMHAGYPMPHTYGLELDPVRAAMARGKGHMVTEADALRWRWPENAPRPARIVMNPPFSQPGHDQVYIEHVERAWYSFLAPGGILAGIAPGGLSFREDTQTARLRALVEQYGGWEPLPWGSLLPHTNVNCVLFWLEDRDT